MPNQEKDSPEIEDVNTPETSLNEAHRGDPSTADDIRCVCTKDEEDAEFMLILEEYVKAVVNARAEEGGDYQAANDMFYFDWGFGLHKVGNCADWAQVSWAALVTRTWKCWRVQKIRAFLGGSLGTYHHFVQLRAVCSGRIVFLDPWRTGNPDWWEASEFPFPNHRRWIHNPIRTHEAGDPPRDPGHD